MKSADVRRGVTQATFNQKIAGFLYLQVLAVPAGIGYMLNSWIVFGVLLLQLAVGVSRPKLALFIVTVFSIGWSAIAFYVVGMFAGLEGQIVAAIVCGIMALGANMAGVEWTQDMKKPDTPIERP